MRSLRILVVPSLLWLAGFTTAIENDFSAYPQASQNCLYKQANATSCTGSTGNEMNQCLCTNTDNFVYNTAKCVARHDPNDLDTVYSTMSNNCQGTGITLVVSRRAWNDQAAAATATKSSSPTATSTSTDGTASSTSTDDGGDGSSGKAASSSSGMSTATRIAIGCGIGFGVLAILTACMFIYLFAMRRRRPDDPPANTETATNMGGQPPSSAPSYTSPAFSASTYGNTPSEAWKSPTVTNSGGTPLMAPAGYYEPPKDNHMNHLPGESMPAELGNTAARPEAPIELPGESYGGGGTNGRYEMHS